MENMKRFAIYYTPRPGAFAEAAADWLGFDLQTGQARVHPPVDLPRPLAEITAEPRKYGFHGTIKPPFRLAQGVDFQTLATATAALAASLRQVTLPALELVNLEGFLALIPSGDCTKLQDLASEVVQVLDPFRAALTEAEVARRRPESLTPRQRALLDIYGYPYVMEEFRFHLTLSGPLSGVEQQGVAAAATAHFGTDIPQPFHVDDLCLCGEDALGRFHLLHRYALTA
jgi:putative phosphonate metabolism protein